MMASFYIFLLVVPELYPDIPYGDAKPKIGQNGRVQEYFQEYKTPEERKIFEYFALSLIVVIPAIYYLIFGMKK